MSRIERIERADAAALAEGRRRGLSKAVTLALLETAQDHLAAIQSGGSPDRWGVVDLVQVLAPRGRVHRHERLLRKFTTGWHTKQLGPWRTRWGLLTAEGIEHAVGIVTAWDRAIEGAP